MYRTRFYSGLLVAAALVASATSARGELIVNGSFETPGVPEGSYSVFLSGSTAITGWTVVGGYDVAVLDDDVQANGITFNAQHGNQWLDLTGADNVPPNSATNGVTQTVATEVGVQYELSFYVGSATDGAFFFPATVDLSIDGGTRVGFTNPTAPSNELDWQLFEVLFTAQNALTTIAFYNGSGASNYNTALDNVSLEAVPEPSSLALVAGLVGGAWWKRRRSKQAAAHTGNIAA